MDVPQTGKQKIFVLPFAAMLIMIGAGVAGHLRYQPYLEQATVINPLLRDRKRHFLGYEYYPLHEQRAFQQLNDIEALRHSELYKEERVEEPVEYVGEENTLHYFKDKEGELFKASSINVEFQEHLDSSRLVGSRFVLEDSGFETIGFKNPDYVMFESIVVPIEDERKTYEAEFPLHVPETAQVFPKWNFSS